MSKRLLFFCIATALLGHATPSSAQLLKGDRVRLELESGRKVEGNWVSANADSITIARQDSDVQIDRDWVERVQRYEGTHRNWGRGAAVGAASGFLFGTALAVLAGGELEDNGEVAYVVVGFTLLGAAPGFLIGGLIKTDKWETVPIDDISLSPHIRGDKISLVLNASF